MLGRSLAMYRVRPSVVGMTSYGSGLSRAGRRPMFTVILIMKQWPLSRSFELKRRGRGKGCGENANSIASFLPHRFDRSHPLFPFDGRSRRSPPTLSRPSPRLRCPVTPRSPSTFVSVFFDLPNLFGFGPRE